MMTNNEKQVEKNFIDEEITVEYRQEPLVQKVPICPDFFVWRGNRFEVKGLLSEWSDMARRGKSSRNMRPAHLNRAEKLGSWGVGRFYFRVATCSRHIFVLYYDRMPKNVAEGRGRWVLFSEEILTDV